MGVILVSWLFKYHAIRIAMLQRSSFVRLHSPISRHDPNLDMKSFLGISLFFSAVFKGNEQQRQFPLSGS